MSDNLLYLKPKGDVMRATFPTENRFIKKVEYLKEGGVRSWFIGEKYPEKQLVYPEMFAVLNPFKRVLPALFKLIKKSPLAKILLVIAFICPGTRKLRSELLEMYGNVFWSGLALVAFKPEYLCPSAHELHRALMGILKEGKNKASLEQIIECLVLFWEYDNAYRYRGQDFAGILDKQNFLKKPITEAKRAFDEYLKRELILKDKTKMFKLAITLVLSIPKYRRLARAIVTEIDFDKVKLDEGDRYWCYHRTDYNADGLDLYTRMRKRAMMKLS